MASPQHYKLFDHVEMVTSIICDKCYKEETCDSDEFESIEYFHEEGWTVFRNKVYCPKCSKLRAKKQKK
ncbi:MAG: hypothetical protein HC836_32970 [Richelia sp. RM2_1_2]|nr:hypothetical protein [Richelia sp. RM2_1_2]